MSKVMGTFVKFTKTSYHSPNMVMSRDPDFKFRKFFSPNSVLNFRKSYQLWGIDSRTKKLQAKKQTGGGKHPPPVLIGLTRPGLGANKHLYAVPSVSLSQLS